MKQIVLIHLVALHSIFEEKEGRLDTWEGRNRGQRNTKADGPRGVEVQEHEDA